MRHVYWPGVFALFAIVLLLTVLDRHRTLRRWPFNAPTLDEAQAKFEANPDTSRGYNWPWYHQKKAGMDLRCSDSADESLRFCTVVLPYVHPDTLEPLGVSFDSFACSTTVCAWDLSGAVDVNP